jgi:hypothetical protein
MKKLDKKTCEALMRAADECAAVAIARADKGWWAAGANFVVSFFENVTAAAGLFDWHEPRGRLVLGTERIRFEIRKRKSP